MNQAANNRQLNFEIFRFNPADPAKKPRMQTYTLQEEPYMTLFRALNQIREAAGSEPAV